MTLVFFVELNGGLANRLRALWSAHAFALRYRRPVVVIWPITPEFACDYNKLFTLNSPLYLINVDPARPLQNIGLRLSRWIFSTVRLGLNCPIDGGEAWGRPVRYAPLWMPFQWIQTCAEFECTNNFDAPFLPLPSLTQQASSRLSKARFDGDVLVGVHIRRTDHRHSISCSNTNAFITEMQSCLTREPSTRFLLCTDDPSEVEPLRNLFGNRLIWYPPKCLDRSRYMSGIDAFIDFLTLSGCNMIYCSYLSSFSLLAARTGRVPYTVIGNPDSGTT